MAMLTLLGIIFSVILAVVLYIKHRYKYWKSRSVAQLQPDFFFGDTKDVFVTFQQNIGKKFLKIYKEFKKRGLKHGGVYIFTSPIYVPIDPETIKHIMQKDFSHFVNRSFYTNEKDDPLSGNLFVLEGDKWKSLRIKLTPTFTSGKMKMMFHTIVDSTKGLTNILSDYADDHVPVDIKEILARFTMDIIGSCAFGLQCNTMENPDAEFRTYGRLALKQTKMVIFKQILVQMFPAKLLHFFRLKVTDAEVEKFFMNVVKDTVSYREKNNIYRKDFMHLLLQLKNRGNVTDDDNILKDHLKNESALSIEELAAQCFVFFLAGFETSSTTMTFALYELAMNQTIQDKVREEINEILYKYDNTVTYEAVKEMTYLDKVIKESLRKYPPLPILQRRCNETYKVPNSNVVIEKGVEVIIPVLGIQMDPDYYPCPEKFDPERFTEENKAKRHAFTYLPFGEGPRVCIGLRFGLLQSKVGLLTVLRNYRITLSNKTKLPLEMEKVGLVPVTEGGMWLNVTRIN